MSIVCGRPVGLKGFLQALACGQVLSCVRPRHTVTTLRGEPYFFMICLRTLSAAALSRFDGTTAHKTSR